MYISRIKFSFLVSLLLLAFGALVFAAGKAAPPPPGPGPASEKAEAAEKEKPNTPEPGKLPDGVVATIDGEHIKIDRFYEFLFETFGARGMSQYIDLLLIERQAKKYGVSVDEKEINDAVDSEMKNIEARFADKLEDILKREFLFTKENLRKVIYPSKRRELLMEKAMKKWMLEPERCKEEIEKRFNQRFKKESEYFRASRITLTQDKDNPDREEFARQLAKDISEGKITFEDAAKEHSKDRYKDAGGDMGFFPVEMMKTQAVFMVNLRALKVGEISEPFKTQFGWNIIRLDAHHPANSIEIKHVEDFLKAELENEKPNRMLMGQFMEKIKGSAKIIIDLK